MKQKNLLLIIATFLMLAVIIVSCTKDNEDTLPELPPVEALMIDFSDFSDDPSTLKSVEPVGNFLHAYLSATVWNLIQVVYLAVPVAAYAEAFNQTPVYLGDNKWQWQYSVTYEQNSLTATVTTERISNEEFITEMLLSVNGGDNLKWFDGTVRYDRTHASWNVYNPETGAEVLDIEWNMDWETELSDITFTGADGGYITYGIVEGPYDAFYTISGDSNTLYIKWNRSTKEGRVKDQNKFDDNEWHCWDAQLMDVDCQ